MIWRYGNEQFSRFALYRAAVLDAISQDLEPWDWPWLRKTRRLPTVAATRQRSRRWPATVPSAREEVKYVNH